MDELVHGTNEHCIAELGLEGRLAVQCQLASKTWIREGRCALGVEISVVSGTEQQLCRLWKKVVKVGNLLDGCTVLHVESAMVA